MAEQSRRKFIKLTAAGVVAAPFGGAALSSVALAQDRVAIDEPMAQSLNYIEDISTLDKSAFPQFVEGSNCANCGLYGGAADSEWGPCGIFGGREVAGNGWCTAWMAKPS